MIKPLRLCTSILLALATATANAQPVDLFPMYAGYDRASVAELRAADEKLIVETTRHFGSREKASAAFIGNGFAYYGRNDLANAMRRFNQAWLLDPNNPEVYFGFAVVLHDRGKFCDASAQFEKAASFGRYIPGMAPDAARALVLCAVEDKSLSGDAKALMFSRADRLYEEALSTEPYKGYVHASRAASHYWRGNYAASWDAVKLAKSLGGKIPEKFLQMLSAKLPEPQ